MAGSGAERPLPEGGIIPPLPALATTLLNVVLEVFNAVGGTIAVATVRESQIENLRSDEVLSVRPREVAAA